MITAPRFWYQKPSFLIYLLMPLAFIYRAIVFIRRWLYRVGIKKTNRFSVPVIIVGNITVGGSGKTPLVIWLINQLRKRGFNPGLVSRGYGGKPQHSPQTVTRYSNPQQVGDEAILLKTKTDCPMVVSIDRVAAVRQLLQNNHCDIVISDDGLQHYSLGRDIEIVIIDDDSLGNAYCLPAGPLREPQSRLNTVDFVITKQMCPIEIYQLSNPKQKLCFNELKGKTIHAIAALGNPRSFFRELERLGANIIMHSFPDHYFYKPCDFNFDDDKIIILSEKDAVKCESFNNDRIFCLVAELVVPDKFEEAFFEKFNHILSSQLFHIKESEDANKMIGMNYEKN